MTAKIAITLDEDLLARLGLDRLVKDKQYPSRSRAVQEAIRDKLDRAERMRLPASAPSSIRISRDSWQIRNPSY